MYGMATWLVYLQNNDGIYTWYRFHCGEHSKLGWEALEPIDLGILEGGLLYICMEHMYRTRWDQFQLHIIEAVLSHNGSSSARSGWLKLVGPCASVRNWLCLGWRATCGGAPVGCNSPTFTSSICWGQVAPSVVEPVGHALSSNLTLQSSSLTKAAFHTRWASNFIRNWVRRCKTKSKMPTRVLKIAKARKACITKYCSNTKLTHCLLHWCHCKVVAWMLIER